MSLSHKVVPLPTMRRGQHGSMKPRQLGTLKGAIMRTFEAFGSNYSARVGEILGLGSSQIQRFTDPEHRTAYPRIDHLRALLHAGAPTEILEHLAAEAGCVLLPIDATVCGPYTRQMSEVGHETALLFKEHLEALSDDATPGEIDREEAQRMLLVTERLLSILGGLARSLRTTRGPDAAA